MDEFDYLSSPYPDDSYSPPLEEGRLMSPRRVIRSPVPRSPQSLSPQSLSPQSLSPQDMYPSRTPTRASARTPANVTGRQLAPSIKPSPVKPPSRRSTGTTTRSSTRPPTKPATRSPPKPATRASTRTNRMSPVPALVASGNTSGNTPVPTNDAILTSPRSYRRSLGPASSPMMPSQPMEDSKMAEEVKFLISHGYKPIRNIIVDTVGSQANYIIAYNKRGNLVLINMDQHLSAYTGEVIHSEKIPVVDFPFSLQKGAFECADGACGVAFESENKLNIMIRNDDTLQPEAETLIYNTNNVVKLGDNIMIPIISYAQIIVNPDGILNNTDIITQRLQTDTWKNSNMAIGEASEEFAKLNDAFSRFVTLKAGLEEKLDKSMDQLKSFAIDYETNGINNKKEAESYTAVKYNLIRRSEMFTDLIRSTNKIAELSRQAKTMETIILEQYELLEKEFSSVDSVMAMPLKAK